MESENWSLLHLLLGFVIMGILIVTLALVMKATFAALLASVLMFFFVTLREVDLDLALLYAIATFFVVYVIFRMIKLGVSGSNRPLTPSGKEYKPAVKRSNTAWSTPIIGDSSGFIVDVGFWRRIVVTANHCVEGAGRIEVRNEWFQSEAEVFATDPHNDLALLKIKKRFPRELSSRFRAKLRPSKEDVKLGETVVVLGYPYGPILQNQLTINRGIVSGLRGPAEKHPYHFMFDAAIQDGNSGGPVLTSKGEVIGVVSGKSKFSEDDNIGFASRPRALENLFSRNGLRMKQNRMREKSSIELAEYGRHFVVQIGSLQLMSSFPEQQVLPQQVKQTGRELKENVACAECGSNLTILDGYRGDFKCPVCSETIVIFDD